MSRLELVQTLEVSQQRSAAEVLLLVLAYVDDPEIAALVGKAME